MFREQGHVTAQHTIAVQLVDPILVLLQLLNLCFGSGHSILQAPNFLLLHSVKAKSLSGATSTHVFLPYHPPCHIKPACMASPIHAQERFMHPTFVRCSELRIAALPQLWYWCKGHATTWHATYAQQYCSVSKGVRNHLACKLLLGSLQVLLELCES